MSQVVWFAFSSGGLAVVFCVLVLVLTLRPASRHLRQVSGLAGLFYLAASIYAVPETLGQLLATGFQPLQRSDLPEGHFTIVVLGAGSVTVRDWDGHRYATTDPSASARVLEAVRIFNMSPSATVISSGGLLNPDDPGTPTGEAMADALRGLGVPESQLLVETIARNTHEEAVVVGRMLRERPPDPVVLVTVDMHMRRSLGTFHAAGVRAIPAIARSPEADLPARSRWLPSDRGLWYSGFVAHEVLGIAYYAMRGWFAFEPSAQDLSYAP